MCPDFSVFRFAHSLCAIEGYSPDLSFRIIVTTRRCKRNAQIADRFLKECSGAARAIRAVIDRAFPPFRARLRYNPPVTPTNFPRVMNRQARAVYLYALVTCLLTGPALSRPAAAQYFGRNKVDIVTSVSGRSRPSNSTFTTTREKSRRFAMPRAWPSVGTRACRMCSIIGSRRVSRSFCTELSGVFSNKCDPAVPRRKHWRGHRIGPASNRPAVCPGARGNRSRARPRDRARLSNRYPQKPETASGDAAVVCRRNGGIFVCRSGRCGHCHMDSRRGRAGDIAIAEDAEWPACVAVSIRPGALGLCCRAIRR